MGVPVFFIAAYLYPLIPGVSRIPLCAARLFLSRDCPGCGLTRSFAALTHGHLRASVDFHPLGVVIALWFISLFMTTVYGALVQRPPASLLSQRSRDLVLGMFVGALLVQWIVKLSLA